MRLPTLLREFRLPPFFDRVIYFVFAFDRTKVRRLTCLKNYIFTVFTIEKALLRIR